VDKDVVKGTIVLCEGITQVGFFSGAIGVIFGGVAPQDSPKKFALPATFLSLRNVIEIEDYIKSTRYRFKFCIFQ
jgi:hypothetical protein